MNEENLLSAGDVGSLCLKIGLDDAQALVVSRVLARPDLFYRFFFIPKRRGGMRRISSPYPILSSIHLGILDVFLSGKKVHPCAYAYVKGKSAVENARVHVRCRELLKLDIENFFPSISRQMVFESLLKSDISSSDAFYISKICTLNGGLPQGACTSPVLSNIVFFPIDLRLSALADSLSLRYSRYADDMVFSGEKVPRDLARLVGEILSERGFCLNHEKSQLKVFGAKKIITGISISSGNVKVPKAFKRELRAQIYSIEKFSGDISRLNFIDPLFFERVVGKINYLLQVEPDNKYAVQKKKTISTYHQRFLGLSRDGLIE